jgi:transcriptional regulator with XRE-family HTH domain
MMQEVRQDPEVAAYLDSVSLSIGQWILTERLKRGLTQQGLADMAKTTQTRISQVEAGFDGIKLATINKICKALKIDLPTIQLGQSIHDDAPTKEIVRVKANQKILIGAR